ncbi:MAG: hypothetical protein IPK60_18445 [Sandaracinaceae bacterium]|nr:hypothetical protein [Sandaracinaceae bacterium]
MAQGKLRVAVGDSALRVEHDRLFRVALRRGKDDNFLESRDKISGTYTDRALAAARSLWSRRLIQEHQSAAVFARLLPQLIEAEASLEFKTTVLRMSMDELHHAAICGRVLDALSAAPEIETELATEALPEHADASPLERALRNVMFVSCLSETYAVAITAEEKQNVREPIISRAIERIHADESLHARFGWHYLAEYIPHLSPEALQRTNAYLRVAFGYLQAKELEAMPLAGSFPQALIDECAALGVSDTNDARSLFFETVTHVIIPELEKLGLDATTAWRNR